MNIRSKPRLWCLAVRRTDSPLCGPVYRRTWDDSHTFPPAPTARRECRSKWTIDFQWYMRRKNLALLCPHGKVSKRCDAWEDGTRSNGPRYGWLPISFGRATGRYFGKILSLLTCYAGYISVFFNEKKQGWHDSLANTVVVEINT